MKDISDMKIMDFESSSIPRHNLLGGILSISLNSDSHKSYTLEQWERRVVPALMLGQFSYYLSDEGLPLAFCNWAFVSTAVRSALLTGDRDIVPSDWQSGDSPFIVELIAPFGHEQQVVADVAERVFKISRGDKICVQRGLRHTDIGYVTKSVEWIGI